MQKSGPRQAGASAARSTLCEQGDSVSLFRRTVEKKCYQPSDIACWPLIPFSNRIDHGRFVFDGKEHRLRLDAATGPHALHGLGWRGAWSVISAECRACKLALNHAANEHWPFAFLAEQTFTLNEDGLTIITNFTNSDQNHAPYGLGQHPYIMRPQGTRLFAQVNGVWLTDDTALPTKHINLPATWDWRKGCALDDVFVDNCFEPLQGAVRVVWPDSSELTIEGSDNLRFLIIYNPPLENYVCVELVTHMPDAINRAEKGQSDTGFAVLPSGDIAVLIHRFRYRPAPRPP